MTNPTTDPHPPLLDKDARAEIARVHRSLTNVTPTPDGIARIEELRAVARSLASAVILRCPPSRERSLALTHLEDCAMWAVKSIVLEAPVPEPAARVVHAWTDADGQDWECDAYDHGPFCRQCRQVPARS